MEGFLREPINSGNLKETSMTTIYNPAKKAPVSIWCKIYTNNFSDVMTNRVATGEEIYDFLMEDSGNCFDDDRNVLKGDHNLWYLGCNEKFGEMRYGYKIWRWGMGEASFLNVMMFCTWLYLDGFFTRNQFEALMAKIEEGHVIGDMYRIRDHLMERPGIPQKEAGHAI